MKAKYLEAGEIVNTHGVRGNVKIYPQPEFAEHLSGFKTLYMSAQGARPIALRSAYLHKNCVIAALEGVDDVNAAMALKGRQLWFDRAEAGLKKGEFFLADLIGAQVVLEDGSELGTLEEILRNPTQNVYIVRKDGEEHLIPAVPAFVLNTDADAGIVTVRLIEGM